MSWKVVHHDCDHGHPKESHVYPVFAGEREHQESRTCWCLPEPDADEPRVIVHKRMVEA